ncbi:hypothetical protein [Thermosediminibacter litoriperuensis]|uniref:Uncharacterized protein n=1 Tax=Thermosediminibacter litoriperuensis TaxID=291989 RepID=A0A5S5AU99_9FIRM|nr:hypothetical protein [Thermosediminibacter litoriperuensis]TYP55502.1 hypothetical protein LZ11_01217 [Thermosediminibacter litoriperuensis]
MDFDNLLSLIIFVFVVVARVRWLRRLLGRKQKPGSPRKIPVETTQTREEIKSYKDEFPKRSEYVSEPFVEESAADELYNGLESNIETEKYHSWEETEPGSSFEDYKIESELSGEYEMEDHIPERQAEVGQESIVLPQKEKQPFVREEEIIKGFLFHELFGSPLSKRVHSGR